MTEYVTFENDTCVSGNSCQVTTDQIINLKGDRTRTFDDWLWHPTFEEKVNPNFFHTVCQKIISDDPGSTLDPDYPDTNHIYTKIAKLLKHDLIIVEGDVVYVREKDTLHLLGHEETPGLIAYYMHSEPKDVKKVIDLIESEFMGYHPVKMNKVWRDGIKLVYEDNSAVDINLKTLEVSKCPDGMYPEFGLTLVTAEHFEPLWTYFNIMNQAIADPFFLEKMVMYPFTQPYREKSHVLVGEGGNGKGTLFKMIERLYSETAYCGAPQPKFTGHDAASIAYKFIGKRLVTFEDVGDPSTKFLEWLKPMVTGKLECKSPSGSWFSVDCKANFLMETNHIPEILNLEAHKRRFVIRPFQQGFRLKDYLTKEQLDCVGERGNISAGDLINYFMQIKPYVDDWTYFEERSY